VQTGDEGTCFGAAWASWHTMMDAMFNDQRMKIQTTARGSLGDADMQ
jgi:hypothetical protein